MCVNIKERAIKALICESKGDKGDLGHTHLKKFAILIPYLIRSAYGCQGLINPGEDISAYTVSIPRKYKISTIYPCNSPLFILKIIDCHSMGLDELMKDIIDQKSEDTRAIIALDIYREMIMHGIKLV